MEQRLCLHVGLPKSGSTTLQQNLFRSLDSVAYHALERKGGRYDEGGAFGQMIETVREGHGVDFDPVAFRAWFDAQRERTKRDRHLVSEERFSGVGGSGLAFKPKLLREAFGEADILLILRRPTDLLPSTHFQQRRHPRYGQSAVASLDAWTTEALRHANHYLSPAQTLLYASIADRFADAFGKERVHVAPIEWLNDDPARFAEVLGRALGIDRAIVQAQIARRAPDQNVRPAGVAQALKITRNSGSIWREIKAASAAKTLSPSVHERVSDFVRPSIERLATDWNLDLRNLGY